MQDKDNRRNDLHALTTDLRTKRRREGETLQVFERIIDRPVPNPRVPKIRKPRYDRLRPNEEVLWEATDP
jgi:hypothetical protein